MIIEMYKTAAQQKVVEQYIKANMGGIVNAAIHTKAELLKLKDTDQVVVASAKCLARNIASLIHTLSWLSSNGIRVYFAEENVCLTGCFRTAEILGVLDRVSSSFRSPC